MTVIDPLVVADDAGLRHVEADRLPIRRRRHGRGFRYDRPDGATIAEATRRRIDELAVPPAWTEVRIAADERAHLQAVGVDVDGRRQYRYHPRFREAAERRKFARLGEIGAGVRALRTHTLDVITTGGPADRTWRVAVILRVIDLTLIRVGSERHHQRSGTVGASTLRRRNVDVDTTSGSIELTFTAKGGVERTVPCVDEPLARALVRLLDRTRRSDEPVFAVDGDEVPVGSEIATTASDWIGTDLTAKDLRTWGATSAMTDRLAAGDPTLDAYDAVAELLGNTRDVARSSYVAPAIVRAADTGRLEACWRRSRRSELVSRAESCTVKVLAEATADEVSSRGGRAA